MKSTVTIPARLASNATIGIVNVGAPEPVEFPDRYRTGITRLTSMGFSVLEADHVNRTDGYRSAPPDKVAMDFNAIWADERVDAILCAGGGITANALLPYLDFALFRERPKIFMGASNPTVLLNAILSVASVATFHGPSVIWDFGDVDQPQATRDSFSSVLTDGSPLLGSAPTFLKAGTATGPLVGGNLTSILQLTGSRWMPDFSGSILLWEDIGEDTAHLAAKLTQLANLGIFDQLNGMIVGELVDCSPSGGVTVEEMILDVCAGSDFPIAFGLPFGHTSTKAVLPLGLPVHLAEDGSIELLQRK